MAITDQARSHLYESLQASLGDEAAATMMELLPAEAWRDVARQSKVDRRFEQIDRRFEPKMSRDQASTLMAGWNKAVERAKHWA